MSVLLSSAFAPNKDVPELVDGGIIQRASASSASQRLNRLGAHYRLNVTMSRRFPSPALTAFMADLQLGLSQGAIYPFLQPGLDTGSPGSPVVGAAGQLGMSIALASFAAGYTIQKGQFFNIIQGGVHYLYCAAAPAVANGFGEATVQLTAMIRKSPAIGAVCEFVNPVIEGWLTGNSVAWTRERAGTTPTQFTIEERE